MASTSTLTRVELQQLAKQHGVKANMKNAEIEAALLEKGVVLTKKKGLSVRDPNVMEAESTMDNNTKPSKGNKSVKAESSTSEVDTKQATIMEDAENDENDENLKEGKRRITRASRAADEQENAAKTLDELPPLGRKTRRSATKDDEISEALPEATQELPLAQRRPRRSASLTSQEPGKSDVENDLPKRTSRTRASLKPTVTESTDNISDATVMHESGADLKEQVGQAAPTLSVSAAEADPRSSLGSGKYVSRRRSTERSAILSEIAQELKITVPEKQEERAKEPMVNEATSPSNPEDEIQVAEALEAVLHGTGKNIQQQDDVKVEPIVPQEEVAPPQEDVTKEGTDIRRSALSAGTPKPEEIRSMASSSSEGRRNFGGKAARVIRRVAVPDLPPTPVETKQEADEKSSPKLLTSATAPVETDGGTEKAKSKLSFGRKISVPLVPATPDNLRKQREEAEKMMSDRLERMRTKVQGAMEALDELQTHLVEQKRLHEALKAVREENKRLREALMLEE